MIAHKTSRARKDAAAVASDGRNKAVKVITTGGAGELASLLIQGGRAIKHYIWSVSTALRTYLTLDRVLLFHLRRIPCHRVVLFKAYFWCLLYQNRVAATVPVIYKRHSHPNWMLDWRARRALQFRALLFGSRQRGNANAI